MAWPILAMAGAGLVKDRFMDAPREDRDRRLAAMTQLYSPWTGLRSEKIREADGPLGATIKGATAGLGFASQNAMLGSLGQKKAPSTPVVINTAPTDDMYDSSIFGGGYQSNNPYSLLRSGGR